MRELPARWPNNGPERLITMTDWIIFYGSEGQELCAITAADTFDGEIDATIEQHYRECVGTDLQTVLSRTGLVRR